MSPTVRMRDMLSGALVCRGQAILCIGERALASDQGCLSVLLFLFFFFQAEDGIRDVAVTGVQTCALPISPARGRPGDPAAHRPGDPRPPRAGATRARAVARTPETPTGRSAERPVTSVVKTALYLLPFNAIFSCLPARNAGAIDALIWIVPPVLGLRPMRAARFRASKFPKPVICTFAPFFNSPAMIPLSSNRASIVREASALDIFVRMASAEVSSALFTAVSL